MSSFKKSPTNYSLTNHRYMYVGKNGSKYNGMKMFIYETTQGLQRMNLFRLNYLPMFNVTVFTLNLYQDV